MHKGSRHICWLAESFCEAIVKEAKQQPFGPHAKGEYEATGALRHGQTTWVRDISLDGKHITHDATSNFPIISNWIMTAFKTKNYGRFYWHKLAPTESIDTHNDVTPYFQNTDRFQIFPHVQKGFTAILNGYEMILEDRSLIAFDPSVMHSYVNRSFHDWYFCVFDLYPGSYELPLW